MACKSLHCFDDWWVIDSSKFTNRIDLDQVFGYPILPEPPCFTHLDGTVSSTDKVANHLFSVLSLSSWSWSMHKGRHYKKGFLSHPFPSSVNFVLHLSTDFLISTLNFSNSKNITETKSSTIVGVDHLHSDF